MDRLSCFLCQVTLQPPFLKCLECYFALLPTSSTSSKDEDLMKGSNQVNRSLHDDHHHHHHHHHDHCQERRSEYLLDNYCGGEKNDDFPSMENALICTICASSGRSNILHQPRHQYEVIRDDFPVIPGSSWTAREEMALLDALESCGLGSWPDVAKYLPGRSAKECEKHYYKIYISGQSGIAGLHGNRELPDNFSSFAPYKNTVSSLPPRPAVSSAAYNEISGYSAARGEFATEYDNHAELIVFDLDFSEPAEEGFGSWYEEVKLAVVDIYRYRVYERARRKRMVRKYGLLNAHACSRYFLELLKRFSQPKVEMLRRCMRLMDAEEFLKFVESLKTEVKLRQQVSRLSEYRQEGLTKLHHVAVYQKLKARRLETKRKRTFLVNCINTIQGEESWNKYKITNSVADKIAGGCVVPLPALSRKKAGPLDISGQPEYDKLDPAEKEVCSVARVLPSAYIEFKAILINECRKAGHLKLKKARSLLKIDVNKTRQLFNHLVDTGHINIDPL